MLASVWRLEEVLVSKVPQSKFEEVAPPSAGSAVAENPVEPRECSAIGELEQVGEHPETAIHQKSSTPRSHRVTLAKG